MADFERSSGIGGSDVAAIVGVSPYRSQFDVYLEKTNDPNWAPVEESPEMRLGNLLEPVLAKVYEEDHPGRHVKLGGGAFSTPLWHQGNIIYAHLDGTVYGDAEGMWEAKVAYSDRDWQAGPPQHYEIQARVYLAVTQEPWCDITVLFRQTARFEHYRVNADKEYDEALVKLAERFWREHIAPRIPPEIDGSGAASRYINAIHPAPVLEETLLAPVIAERLAAELVTAKLDVAVAQENHDAVENRLKIVMAEYPRMEGIDWYALWRRSKGSSHVDWKLVAGAYRKAAGDLLTDADEAAILSLYTVERAGARPFLFRHGQGKEKT